MSESAPSSAAAKALLLCHHAEELSVQCRIAIRHGAMEEARHLQERKYTIIDAIAGCLGGLDVAGWPNLQKAVESLRATLRTETAAAARTTNDLGHELQTVRTALNRLALARRYDAAAHPPIPGDGEPFSVCG